MRFRVKEFGTNTASKTFASPKFSLSVDNSVGEDADESAV
jgi:hypothetical protein